MATAEQVKRADRKPKAPPRASWITRKDSILINRVGADDSAEKLAAARTIVRLALGKHGCPQLTDETEHCGPEHDADVADALAALKLLGLAPHEHVRHKFCPGCSETKETTEFSPNARTAGGLRTTCKPCHRVEAAARREAKKRATA